MAGGHMKYRTLSRTSSHRQHLLRNLVTALFQHEAIRTTWPKAKETQRMAEKLVTLGKRNTEAARNRAKSFVYDPALVPRIFSTIRERYASRPGGYTRVLRIEPLKQDQAPSAILELVDSPLDTRFALTARTLARQRKLGLGENEVTKGNVVKVTRFRKDGKQELENLVSRMKEIDLEAEGKKGGKLTPKRAGRQEPAGEIGIED